MIKKITIIFSIVFIAFSMRAQTIILNENFTTYLGTAVTVPVGWTFSYNGFYSTIASSGTSGPNSYKFGVNNATITTPSFTNADTVSFWVKGNTTDSLSALILVQSADSIVWDTIIKQYELPTNTTGQTFKYSISNTSKYLQFIYKKSAGNCAFDDFLLIRNQPLGIGFIQSEPAVFTIFPNPSNTGFFNLNLGSSNNITTITVYNIIGKVIFEKEVNSSARQLIDLSGEAAGSYFVNIKNDKENSTKKISINK